MTTTPRRTLGELTISELIAAARSELTGFRDHLNVTPIDHTDDAQWDALSWEEKFTRGYLISIGAYLTMLDVRVEELRKEKENQP